MQVFQFVGVTITNKLASNSPLAEGLTALQRRHREHENKCLVSYSFTFAIIAGLCTSGVLSAFGPPILSAMGTNAAMMAPALSYLTWRALAAPAVMMMNVCQGVCLGQQNSVTPLFVFSAVGALNVVLDAWLILGQSMGCAGAAIATAAAQWLGALYFFHRLHKTVRCSFDIMRM
jgi:MATE family multidrug resistance protein